MSLDENTRWLENAQMHFEEAMSVKDYALALAIIDDVEDKGFTSEAESLREQYQKALPEDKEYE